MDAGVDVVTAVAAVQKRIHHGGIELQSQSPSAMK
jgi:hypothetical protein